MKKNILFKLVTLLAVLLPMGVMSQTINTFPHSEDLESWNTCFTSCSSTCALSNGWTNTGTNDWRTDVGGTSSSSTGPSTDHSPGTSSGKYLYTEASGCNGPWELVSPAIDLVGTNDLQFTFWYHMYGSSMGNAHVDVSTDGGTTWILDVVPTWTDNQDIWQQKVISLGAYTGTANVRIRHEGNTSFGADFAVDDFLIYDLLVNDAGISAFTSPLIPTCVFNDTVSVELTNYGTDTLTSVTISWVWNTLTQTPVSWTGSLAPGASTNVFLGTAMYGAGDNLDASTSLPNGIVEFPSGAGNNTSAINNLSTGLNGIYTIGGTTPDYTDFASAVNDLSTFGTCGPVIFDVRDGIYAEQIVLTGLSSLSTTNSVTFRSENGDASLVTLTAAGSFGNNYVVQFDGAAHYRFENLTLENTGTSYARIADFTGGSDDIQFKGCHLMATNVNTTSTNAALIYSNTDIDDNLVLKNNIIEGGSYGMYWYGAGSTSPEAGIVLEGNHFLDNYYTGARLYYNDNASIIGNRFDGVSNYSGTRYALYMGYLNGAPEIAKNEIYGSGTSGWYYGLYFFNGGGNASQSGIIRNNMVSVGKPGNTSSIYGIYMSNSGYMKIYHNSVLVAFGGNFSRAFYPASGGENYVKNNIFANYTPGYAMYMGNAFAVTESDYNVLYAPNGNIGYLNGAHTTLADWQGASSFDGNSLDNNPLFYNSGDLHICNDTIGNQGTPLAEVTVDIDGQIRDGLNPDMGADRFTGLSGSFLGPDLTICTGDSVQIAAGAPSDTILWSTGETTPFIWVSTPGTYTVSINGWCGTGTDAVVVNPSAINYSNYLVANDIEFCAGDSVLLYSSQAADTYTWSGGSSATTDSIYATAGGTYTLALSDGCGSGSESINLVENTAPNPTFTANISYLTGIFSNTSTTGANPTYSWNFGDGSTSNDENPSHIYATSGAYYVTLTITNDCGSQTFGDSILLAIQGIDELLVNGDVTVYPNPSNGVFTVDMELITSSQVSFRVENLVGAVIYESNPITIDGLHTETISLGNVPTGVYFVNILAGDNKLVKKIIVR